MKIIFIIYLVSWALILLYYLIKFISSRSKGFKETEESKPPMFYLLLFLFAPLAIFVFPFQYYDKYKASKRDRIYKEKQMKEEKRKDDIFKNYSQDLLNSKKGLSDEEWKNKICDFTFIDYCNKKAQELKSIIREKSYNHILVCLDLLKLKNNARLFVDKDKLGYKELLVKIEDGSIHKDIFNYIEFENSREGAWQVYLLYHLNDTHFYRHHTYDELIFSYNFFERYVSEEQLLEIEKMDLLPEIWNNSDIYYVICCSFYTYDGIDILKRDYTRLSLTNPSDIITFKSDILYKDDEDYDENIHIFYGED